MSQSNTEAPSAQDTLELRDTRTDKTYNATIRTEGPEGDTFVRAMDLRAVKREPGEFGLLSYVVPQRDHLHRRRQGHFALSWLPHRATRRERDVP